jgi:polysaccharide biosynthesis PFTS motif protein
MTNDLLMMKWWNIIFFSDGIDYKLFEFSRAKLARNYYFLTESNNYKPIWAYVAEKKNSKIILLSISVQTEINSFECYDYEGICSSTWNYYYPWNQNHKDYILNKLSDKNVNINVINSYIPYRDCDVEISFPNNSVCFFDYQNHKRNVPHSTLVDYTLAFGDGTAHDLRKKCWLDLILMKKKFNFNIVTKKKRITETKLLFKKDLIFDKYLENNQVIFLDPNIAVERIVKKTKLVITLPFSSPAVIAQNVGVESIYYDAICNLDKNDPNRSNILIISGIDELTNYLKNFFRYKD